MTSLPDRSVCLYVDGAQSPVQLDRGIARYVSEHTRALHATAPSLLHSVLLNPGRSLTGNLSSLLGQGILSWSDGSPPKPRLVGGAPRIYHIMSPFELATPIEIMWPYWARDVRSATVVTLYDVIPLIFPESYLTDPALRAEYIARVELIRHVDGILAISEKTAEDAVEVLRVPEARVHVIHAGTSDHFAAMYQSSEAAWAHIARNLRSVRRGFILYVGGADFRKNLEGMIAAFARLPTSMRAAHQLVIACTLNPGQAESYEAAAQAAGLESGEILLTGHVSDADLGALYRACELFVFPSLYEGFGLPVLEAMSCGAPVVASEATTTSEIFGDRDGTFDPHDPESIASCVAGTLGSHHSLERLRARSRRRWTDFTWQRVAVSSIKAYERVAAGNQRRTPRRPRIAFVTPWLPDPSPTAEYNLSLAAELGQRVDVDVIVGRPLDQYATPLEHGVQLHHIDEFDRLRKLRQHDRILYCMGNSSLHGHVYELLKRHRGSVVLHDVELLSGFYRWYTAAERPGDPDGALAARISEMYGERMPPDATQAQHLTYERQVALGVYLTREVQSFAERCLVHSQFARELLELDRGPRDRQVPVSVLPFAIPNAAQGPCGPPGASPLVVSLGKVDEGNGLAPLIDSFALLARETPTARLVIAGEIDDIQPERWHVYAGERAPGAKIEFTGPTSARRRAALLRSADVAVELRLVSSGEASAAAAACLASGVPTIVTDLGWTSELPEDAVVKVPVNIGADQLRDRMAELIRDDGRRARVSGAALAHARAYSFARVADAYLDALDLR